MNLLSLLSQQINSKGDLAFVDFMQRALYDPHYGYYSRGVKFGRSGDFTTAPELTNLFGKTLANQCQQILSGLDKACLLEFGAGSGRLCVDILQHLASLNALPAVYYILEVSGSLRQQQQILIQQEIPHLSHMVQWLEHWPEDNTLTGIVIANEVLDAMPVHRFLQTENGLLESFITLDDRQQLREVFKPCTNLSLLAHIEEIGLPPCSPYLSEANLFITAWIKQCYLMLKQGVVLLIDYGFPRHEYYHVERNMGTLMCHYQNKAHTNPLLNIGDQDITAHVDFTHVAQAGVAINFTVGGYTNQASFLLANGLLHLIEQIDDNYQRIKAQQAAKQLLQPSEMGELYKVIALMKNITLPLQGFTLQDKRARL